MSKELPIIYISLTGNTHNFVTRLKTIYAFLEPSLNVTLTNVKDLVKGQEDYFKVGKPFVAFLPTYLEGGNGVDNGDVEVLTNPLGDFLAYEHNYAHCFGVIGREIVTSISNSASLLVNILNDLDSQCSMNLSYVEVIAMWSALPQCFLKKSKHINRP